MDGDTPRVRTRLVAPGDPALTERRASSEDEVCVWLADPAAWGGPENSARLRALLSEDERGRLERFRFDEDRAAFLVTHGLLRLLLSGHAPVAPERWTFRADGYGQPGIAAPASPMRFSLSHTRRLVACAVVDRRPVGIDVEDASRVAPLAVAERYFAPGERRDLAAHAPGERGRRFFEYWTLKEAYAKARGLGLQLPFDRFELHRRADGSWHVADPASRDRAGAWWFHAWSTPTHQAALALGPA